MSLTPTTDPGEPEGSPRPEPRERMPATWCTTAILVANVAVFVAMVAKGSGVQESSVEILHAWGGNSGREVADGQWWRLLTCAFLHGGVVHLAVNMYSLHVVGRPVELFFGRGPFLVVYFFSALCASMSSLAWTPDIFSVGASGAIMGLFGAIAAFFVANRERMPRALFRSQMQRMALVLAINVLIGFGIPNIDQAAHVGGLVSGFVVALVIVRGFRTGRLNLHVAAATLVVLAATPVLHARLLADPEVGTEVWRRRAQAAWEARDWVQVREAADHLVELGPKADLGRQLRAYADQQSRPR